jgi:hypothetical protein
MTSKSHKRDYSDQFKPAVQLGRPTLDDWSENFYAQQIQERFVEGEHYQRLCRTPSQDPELVTATQLRTPVPGYVPTFREVTLRERREQLALCIDNGPNHIGVFLYLLQPLDAGNSIDARIQLVYMPFATLSDISSVPKKPGPLEVRLPDTDYALLDIMLRPSPTGEPEYRTTNTEVYFDEISEAQRTQIRSTLNFQAASIAAFGAYQLLNEIELWGAMTTGDASLAVAVPPWASTAKKVTVATLVSIGAVVGVIGQAIDDNTTKVVGLGFAGAALITNYWLGVWVPDWPQPATAAATVVPARDPESGSDSSL